MSVPTQVTPFGQRPVTESRDQVEATGFLDRLYGRSVVCPDGNKAWKAAAEARGIEVQSVVHQVKNFTSVGPVRWKNVSNVAGTQVIDRSWKSLKNFLPQHMCLKFKEKGHSKMHPSVPEYIYMWTWRQSLGTTSPKKFLAALEYLL